MIKIKSYKLRIKKEDRSKDRKGIKVRKMIQLFRNRSLLRKIKHNGYVEPERKIEEFTD
jgi:hypothetical protein